MPMPEDFAQECLYGPESWFCDEIVELDKDAQRIVIRFDTDRAAGHPLISSQREVSGHERHIPAAIMVQMTGTLGNLHSTYVLGLRLTEGWFGYGTKIREARFRTLATVGPPIFATATATKSRCVRGTWFVDYDFRYEQEGNVIYESKQSAVWLKNAPES